MSASSVIARIPPRGRQAIVIALRFVVAAVFAVAAIPKLLDPVEFARDIANYQLLPERTIGPFAVALPMLEIVVAAALLTGIRAAGAAIVAALMLLGFVVAMGQALVRGIDLECGCFGGAIEARVNHLAIARNLLLALACVPIVLAHGRGLRSRPDETGPANTEPANTGPDNTGPDGTGPEMTRTR